MNFSQVKGNREVVRTLVSMVDSGRIPHAVMFHEEDGGEAFPLCLALLSYLYCRNRAHSDSCSQCPSCNRIDKLIHPDVHFIFPIASSALTGQYMAQLRGLVSEKLPFTEDDVCSAFGIEGKRQIIAVGEARHLLDSLSVTALEGGYRSVVIYLPEKMNAEAANRLLKIVEEPPPLTLFLMITHHPEQVLQTISSRCLHIQVERAGTDGPAVAFQSPELFDGLMDALCSRDLLSCHEAADRLSALPSREDAKAFCKFAAYRLRHIFLAQQGLPLPPDAGAQVARWAPLCRKSFPRNALGVLDRASRMLDLNVNVKILFADMADKLFLYI